MATQAVRTASCVDHEDPAAVAALSERIERDQGRLDLLVNDIFGGDRYMEWDKPLWEHDWRAGADAADGRAHASDHVPCSALPLILRTAEARDARARRRDDGRHHSLRGEAEFRGTSGFYYDLVKANVERIVKGLTCRARCPIR